MATAHPPAASHHHPAAQQHPPQPARLTTMSSAASNKRPRVADDQQANASIQFQKRRKKRQIVKKELREQIGIRPETYVGDPFLRRVKGFVPDPDTGNYVYGEYATTKALETIIDEPLVNAIDHYWRDPTMTCLEVKFNPVTGQITVKNDGNGIPCKINESTGIYNAELCFGHLLTSDNYDDDEERIGGGRNGYGVKLTNIFSRRLDVETLWVPDADETGGTESRIYRQTFEDGMSKIGKPRIRTTSKDRGHTMVSFLPDYARFGFPENGGPDAEKLLLNRVWQLAAVAPAAVTVKWNGKKVKANSMLKFAKRFPGVGKPRYVSLNPNGRWQAVVMVPPEVPEGELPGDAPCFVNGVHCPGGTHAKLVRDPLLAALSKSKTCKGSKLRRDQIGAHAWVMVSAVVVRPVFDKQTKDALTSHSRDLGSLPTWEADTINKVLKGSGVAARVAAYVESLSQARLARTAGKRQGSTVNIPKLEDAHHAGRKGKSRECTLIVTEGDSAASLAVGSIPSRKQYGVMALKGKVMNVSGKRGSTVQKSEQIVNLWKAMGLEVGRKPDRDALRYGQIMIMCDQDADGSHIKGLVLNVFRTFFPETFRWEGFFRVFHTPIIKIRRRGEARTFYTLASYEAWVAETPDHGTWKAKYYKGLGTSTSKEGKEYFENIGHHCVPFAPASDDDAWTAIDGHFATHFDKGSAHVAARKAVVRSPPAAPKERPATIAEFFSGEFPVYERVSVERALPSVVDGQKPSQRKVIFVLMRKKWGKLMDGNEIKVSQFGPEVSLRSGYHHGEKSLTDLVIRMAQTYTGSNAANLIEPHGQFGTRGKGGDDAASPRYVFCEPAKCPDDDQSVARAVFPQAFDPVLHYEQEDGQDVEPTFFCGVVPMLLVNGARGIGSGFSTHVHPARLPDVVDRIRRHLSAGTAFRDMEPLRPHYVGFKGAVAPRDDRPGVFEARGIWRREGARKLVVTELPPHVKTNDFVKAARNHDAVARVVNDSTEHDVRVEVMATSDDVWRDDAAVLGVLPDLVRELSTRNMHCLDHTGAVRKYEDYRAVLAEYASVLLEFYAARLSSSIAAEREEVRRHRRVRTYLDFTCGSDRRIPVPVEARVRDEHMAAAGFAAPFEDLRRVPLYADEIAARDRKIARGEAEISRLEGLTPRTAWLEDLDRLVHLLRNHRCMK